MTDKIQGTLVLDGLIEGPLPGPKGEDLLRTWCSGAAKLGLHFNLEIDSGKFSILADNRPIQVAGLPGEASEVVTSGLQELLGVFAPEQRPQVFSTLRSAEFRPDQEVQTLYFVGPDGSAQSRSRTIQAKTTPPPSPVTIKRRLLLAGGGLAVAAIVVLVTSLFVDYGQLIRGIIERGKPLKADSLDVSAGAFGDYLTVRNKSLTRIKGTPTLVLELGRTDKFPLKDQDYAVLMDKADSLPKRLAVQALASGYVRVELYDKKGQFMSFDFYRLGLKDAKDSTLRIPMPTDEKPAKVVVTY